MIDPSFAASRRVEKVDGGYMVYVKPPPITGNLPEGSVFLTSEQYTRYQQWRHGPVCIQDALTELSPSEREILMTGLSDKDFARIAGDDRGE